MKVNVGQVQKGLAEYIENEIVAKLADWRRWVFGAGASVLLVQASGIFNTLKAHPVIMMMGVVDSNDLIDLDLLYAEFKKQAEKGAVTFDVPVLGPLTLDGSDVNKLYNYIKNAQEG